MNEYCFNIWPASPPLQSEHIRRNIDWAETNIIIITSEWFR